MNINMIITTVNELNEKGFFADPMGWISRGVTQGIGDFFTNIFSKAGNFILDGLDKVSDSVFLYIMLFLLMAKVFGFDLSKRYIGLTVTSYLFIQLLIATR